MARTGDMVNQVLALYESGLGYRATARELRSLGVTVDWSTVRRLIKANAAPLKGNADRL